MQFLFFVLLQQLQYHVVSTAGRSRIENQIQNAVDPNAIPTLPTAVPPASTTPSEGQDKPCKIDFIRIDNILKSVSLSHTDTFLFYI